MGAEIEGTFYYLLVIGLTLYILPTIIATARKHSNAVSIFILNLFLGWTFLGWIIALIWSFAADTKLSVINALQEYKEIEELEKRKKELEKELAKAENEQK